MRHIVDGENTPHTHPSPIRFGQVRFGSRDTRRSLTSNCAGIYIGEIIWRTQEKSTPPLVHWNDILMCVSSIKSRRSSKKKRGRINE